MNKAGTARAPRGRAPGPTGVADGSVASARRTAVPPARTTDTSTVTVDCLAVTYSSVIRVRVWRLGLDCLWPSAYAAGAGRVARSRPEAVDNTRIWRIQNNVAPESR